MPSHPLALSLESLAPASIKIDPLYVPQSLEIRKVLQPDKARIDSLKSIFENHGYREPPIVWRTADSSTLLSGYESYLAARSAAIDPDQPSLPCLCLSGLSDSEAKALATQLQRLSASTAGNHLERLVNIELLVRSGFQTAAIRRLYGINRSRSAEGKRLERDFRIVTAPELLNLVLGRNSETSEAAGITPSFLHLNPGRATLRYGEAVRICGVLRHNSDALRQFCSRHAEYISSLRTGLYPDETAKPPFSWHSYEPQRVIATAIEIARRGDPLNFDVGYVLGADEKADFNWPVDISKDSLELSIPALKLHLGRKTEANIKKVVEAAFKLKALAHSHDSYLRRINPIEHGAPIRLQSSEIGPYFDTQGNSPRFEDSSYADFIRKNKLLRYCNRERLLRSYRLRTSDFGFSGYAHYDTSTYAKARTAYEGWYNSKFLADVGRFYSSRPERHPYYPAFIEISAFLARSGNDGGVFFSDFINGLFSNVFAVLDANEQRGKEVAAVIAKESRKLRTAKWDELIARLRDERLSPSEIIRLIETQIAPKEDRIMGTLETIETALSNAIPGRSET